MEKLTSVVFDLKPYVAETTKRLAGLEGAELTRRASKTIIHPNDSLILKYIEFWGIDKVLQNPDNYYDYLERELDLLNASRSRMNPSMRRRAAIIAAVRYNLNHKARKEAIRLRREESQRMF